MAVEGEIVKVADAGEYIAVRDYTPSFVDMIPNGENTARLEISAPAGVADSKMKIRFFSLDTLPPGVSETPFKSLSAGGPQLVFYPFSELTQVGLFPVNLAEVGIIHYELDEGMAPTGSTWTWFTLATITV